MRKQGILTLLRAFSHPVEKFLDLAYRGNTAHHRHDKIHQYEIVVGAFFDAADRFETVFDRRDGGTL
ncbi:MAG: hypothetical protein MJ082_02280 [Clostridia bacterium]|nr:hypothetical protein [Clostridia bacterium]